MIIGGVRLVALVDSSSTHTFIAQNTAHSLGLAMAPRKGMSVTVANGDRVPCVGLCSKVTLQVGEEDFSIDCFTIPLDSFELVLGIQWLRTLGLITWDFELLSMSFWRTDHQVV